MAQVVADDLGVDIDDVTIVQGDTRSTPYGPAPAAAAPRSIAGGAAREAAARGAREGAARSPPHMIEAAPEDLEIADGVVSVRGTPAKSVTMAEVAKHGVPRRADSCPPGMEPGLEATVRFRPTPFLTWSNACHVCDVEVDATTGEVRSSATSCARTAAA